MWATLPILLLALYPLVLIPMILVFLIRDILVSATHPTPYALNLSCCALTGQERRLPLLAQEFDRRTHLATRLLYPFPLGSDRLRQLRGPPCTLGGVSQENLDSSCYVPLLYQSEGKRLLKNQI